MDFVWICPEIGYMAIEAFRIQKGELIFDFADVARFAVQIQMRTR